MKEAGPKWLPIETAPKGWDAPLILVHNPVWDEPVQMVRLKDNSVWAKGYKPTQWMPVPATEIRAAVKEQK